MTQKNRGKQDNMIRKTQAQRRSVFVLGVTLIGLVALGFLVSTFLPKDGTSGDLIIVKSDITETVKFYPYKSGSTKMEVLAVKASDGSIRTAFNTCQVCFTSGRGYYVQEGDQLVCQNCGNRFQLDQIEVIRGGCNPVPIPEENKTDDGTSITIPQAFLEEYKVIFENWRK